MRQSQSWRDSVADGNVEGTDGGRGCHDLVQKDLAPSEVVEAGNGEQEEARDGLMAKEVQLWLWAPSEMGLLPVVAAPLEDKWQGWRLVL